MRPIIALLAAFTALLFAGCDYDKYVIDMRPEGDSCRRTIVCWRGDDDARPPKIMPLAGEKAEAISKLYPPKGVVPDLEPGKRGFTGVFKGTLPQDVGGLGSYTRLQSELGDLFIYVERFRGEPDQAKVLARAAYCADQLTELLALWLSSEMKDDPRLPQLLAFIRGGLREDLHNVSLYSWMPQFARNSQRLSADRPEHFAVQGGQFLVERGYFKIEDVPVLLAALSNQQERDVNAVLRLAQRQAATRMGVPADQPVPPSMAFLADTKRAAESYQRFRTTDAYRQWLTGIDIKRATGKATAKLDVFDPDQPVESLLQRMVSVSLWFGQDKVEVTLHCGEKPFSTNGTWEEPTSSVGWAGDLPPEDGLPLLLYAFWTVPDNAFQKAHFGRRILENEKLADYALWRATLTPAEATEWGTFLASLKPGPQLLPKVKAWRFASDRALPEDEPGFVTRARTLLVDHIGDK